MSQSHCARTGAIFLHLDGLEDAIGRIDGVRSALLAIEGIGLANSRDLSNPPLDLVTRDDLFALIRLLAGELERASAEANAHFSPLSETLHEGGQS
jgi:hypothetical protein